MTSLNSTDQTSEFDGTSEFEATGDQWDDRPLNAKQASDASTRKGIPASSPSAKPESPPRPRVCQQCVDDVVEIIRYISASVGEDMVGDFLSEPGKTDLETDLIVRCRRRVIASLDFRDLPFDVALRRLLTKGGFRLPGEAQKIDRITETFAEVFCEQNPHPDRSAWQRNRTQSRHRSDSDLSSASGALGKAPQEEPSSIAMADGRLFPWDEDLPYLLAFSLIMLNTDLYNPAIREDRKMTLPGFLANNSGVDKDSDGNPRDLPKPFLEHLFFAVRNEEIKALKPMQVAPAPS